MLWEIVQALWLPFICDPRVQLIRKPMGLVHFIYIQKVSPVNPQHHDPSSPFPRYVKYLSLSLFLSCWKDHSCGRKSTICLALRYLFLDLSNSSLLVILFWIREELAKCPEKTSCSLKTNWKGKQSLLLSPPRRRQMAQ